MFSKSKPQIRLFFIIIFSISILVTACGGAAAPTQDLRGFEAPAMPAAPMEAVEAESGYAGDYEEVNDAAKQSVERIVIQNADLSIIVDDPSQSMDLISRMAKQMGGFVVSANLSKQELEGGVQVPRASITIRIPADRLNEALDTIKAESDQDPISENLSSQDVTSDYVDLQSRLRNLEKAEAKLTEIMDSAVKTEDVLSVYNELVRVQGEIEVTKGRIKYYDEAAALSSISTSLIANEAVQPITVGGWQPTGVAKNAIQALISALKFLATAAIWIILFLLPVLLILFVFIYLPLAWIRRIRRQRREKANGKEEKTPPSVEVESE